MPVFLGQVVPELALVAEGGIKVGVNTGAFNSARLAAKVREEVAARSLPLNVAYIRGDDVLPDGAALAGAGELVNLDTGAPLGDSAGRLLAANEQSRRLRATGRRR